MFIPRSPQFTPFPVGPPVGGYGAWYDAADASSLTLSGSDVTVWADKARMGNDLAFVTTAPTYTSRKINNITCVEFQPGSSRMDQTTGLALNSDSTATWFFVGLLDTLANVRTMMGYSAGNNGMWMYATSAGSLQMDVNSALGVIGPVGTVTAGIAYQATLWMDTPNSKIRLNTTEFTSTTGFGFDPGNRLILGSFSSHPFDGLIGEIIMYPTALSAPEIVLVETYLKSKWGTP